MSETATKLRKLTVKQANFVKAKSEGLTGVEAVRRAYGTTNYNTAAAMASENLNKPNINEAIQAEMVKKGIDIASIIRPVKDALTAEKVHIVGNGEQAMADVVPDHAVRLKAVTIASQFMGIGRNVEGGTNINFINVSKSDQNEFGI